MKKYHSKLSTITMPSFSWSGIRVGAFEEISRDRDYTDSELKSDVLITNIIECRPPSANGNQSLVSS